MNFSSKEDPLQSKTDFSAEEEPLPAKMDFSAVKYTLPAKTDFSAEKDTLQAKMEEPVPAMIEPSRIQILGHSYVQQLKGYIEDSDNRTLSLGLRDTIVEYSCFPGATVPDLVEKLQVVKDFDPDIVILIVGTNDLLNPQNSPLSVANAIKDLADKLFFVYHVPDILVCEIFHRIAPSQMTDNPVDLAWFNPRVIETNKALIEKLATCQPHRARLWYFKGFWGPEGKVRCFSEDGVSLSLLGQKKLYFQLRIGIVATRNSTCKALEGIY